MSSISPKKRTKKFDFTTIIPQVDLFSFVSWEKLKTPKRHFEINWPLASFFFHDKKLDVGSMKFWLHCALRLRQRHFFSFFFFLWSTFPDFFLVFQIKYLMLTDLLPNSTLKSNWNDYIFGNICIVWRKVGH